MQISIEVLHSSLLTSKNTIMFKEFKDSRDALCSHHVGRQLVSRQVFSILVFGVDDLGEFASINHLLKDPHLHSVFKRAVFGCIGAHYLGNGRTPEEMKEL